MCLHSAIIYRLLQLQGRNQFGESPGFLHGGAVPPAGWSPIEEKMLQRSLL